MSQRDAAFAELLRTSRRNRGLSQAALAEAAGMSVRAISDLERGRTRSPYPDSVRRLADALGLRDGARDEFFAAAGPPVAGHAPGGPPVVPRQLPAAVAGFVGRRDQLAVLSRVLREPGGTAVITAIGGTAGVGKTTLAVHWAHQVADEFPDGQLFVNLRGFGPSQEPMPAGDAVRAFLDALQVPADRLPRTTEAQIGLYRSLLTGRRMLIVLDNARDAEQVRPLLPGSPTCRVVVTSRNQLAGLAAIDAARLLTVDTLTSGEAVQLLENRLGAERLAGEARATALIVQACVGLPLALCTVAARAAMRPDLSLAHVADDLATRAGLDAFTGGGDPSADVRTALSWSYRQLDAVAARAFRLLGLHPGTGFDRYGAAALAGVTAAEADRALDALTRAYLIQPAGTTRYGMHDLLRAYARELAKAHDTEQERHAALTRLFDHYLYAAATAMDVAFPAERHRRPRIPAPRGPAPVLDTEAAALAWLDTERPNLAAVSTHATDHGWPRHAVDLAGTVFRYLESGVHHSETTTLLTNARRMAHQLGDLSAEGHALHHLGGVTLRQGHYQQGRALLEEALDLYRETGDRQGQAGTLANLGIAALFQGRHQQAVGYFEQSLALHREDGDLPGQARALGNLSFAAMRQGDYPRAADHLHRSLALSRAIRDRTGVARALANLGEVAVRQHRYDEATGHLTEALALFRETGNRNNEADILATLGIAELRQRHYRQATDHLHQALALSREVADAYRQAIALNGLGEVLNATGHPAEARARHAAALRAATEIGEKYEQARAHHGLASAHRARGASIQARHHRDRALALYTELNAPEADEIRVELAAPGREQVT